jgi:hypothetical protein
MTTTTHYKITYRVVLEDGGRVAGVSQGPDTMDVLLKKLHHDHEDIATIYMELLEEFEHVDVKDYSSSAGCMIGRY